MRHDLLHAILPKPLDQAASFRVPLQDVDAIVQVDLADQMKERARLAFGGEHLVASGVYLIAQNKKGSGRIAW